MRALVSYHLQEKIATITMDDGKANVVSVPMQAELNAALDQAVTDKAVVVLTGRDGIFSAGFDLKALYAGGEDALKMLTGGFRLAQRLLSFPRPVVIACSGHALAMGAFLVLCGDYRIGVDGPYKIGANEVAIGLSMPRAAVEICRDRLTPAHFNRSVLNANIYRPMEAVAAGFLDKVVLKEELQIGAHHVASEYARLNMPAYEETKARVRERLYNKLRTAIGADYADFRVLCNLTQ
jgi:enoyl-CoA hydratase